jgi:hypothetical protein
VRALLSTLFLIRLRFDYDQTVRVVANRPNLVDQFVVLLKGWGKCSHSTKTIILKLAAAFNQLNKKGGGKAKRAPFNPSALEALQIFSG